MSQARGKNKAAVSDEVLTSARHIESLLKALAPLDDTPAAQEAAALAHWSKTSLSATSHVPWQDGKQSERDRTYSSQIDFDIRFKEFKALGAFSAKISALPHVEVRNIEWKLTPATEKHFEAQLRKEASQDALQKAYEYCEVLRCVNVRPLELNEGDHFIEAVGGPQTVHRAVRSKSGPRGGLFGSVARNAMSFSAMEDAEPEPELEFTPQELRMSLNVELKFQAE